MTWDEQFSILFRRCLKLYVGGNKDYTSYYDQADLQFLQSIGYQPREFFDFIEDLAEEGVPSDTTALLVAAVRRDFFLTIQQGNPSTKRLTRNDIPTFGDTLGEIAYLPRIIAKARAKLAGELDPDLMYGCGGDRAFLARHGHIHPADFLRNVWAAGEDEQKILAYVKAQA